MEDDTPVLLTRAQLYEMIWKEPTRTVAARLGISDVGLAKVCRKYHILDPGADTGARRRLAINQGSPSYRHGHRILARNLEPSLSTPLHLQVIPPLRVHLNQKPYNSNMPTERIQSSRLSSQIPLTTPIALFGELHDN